LTTEAATAIFSTAELVPDTAFRKPSNESIEAVFGQLDHVYHYHFIAIGSILVVFSLLLWLSNAEFPRATYPKRLSVWTRFFVGTTLALLTALKTIPLAEESLLMNNITAWIFALGLVTVMLCDKVWSFRTGKTPTRLRICGILRHPVKFCMVAYYRVLLEWLTLKNKMRRGVGKDEKGHASLGVELEGRRDSRLDGHGRGSSSAVQVV
jgi:hypothetical protein